MGSTTNYLNLNDMLCSLLLLLDLARVHLWISWYGVVEEQGVAFADHGAAASHMHVPIHVPHGNSAAKA